MIKLTRAALPPAAADYLVAKTSDLSGKAPADRTTRANVLWRNKSTVRFQEVRNTLSSMCSGIERCMYCEDSVATDIDHYEPKAQVPLKAFEWTNYLAACSGCNSNYKRSEFPRDADGNRLLLDPTHDDPDEHLTFSPTTGLYTQASGSRMASESIRVMGLNREVLAAGRRNAWVLIEASVIAYAHAHRERSAEEAALIAAAVQRQPFAGVLRSFLKAAASPEIGLVAQAATAALESHPEIADWAPKAI